MVKKIATLLALTIAISACSEMTESNDESTSSADNTQTQKTVNSATEITAHPAKDKTEPSLAIDKPRSVTINNKKFQANSIIQPGARVLNLLMGEFGRVKGSFVVTTKEQMLVDSDNSLLATINVIAANTYRITPQKKTNFMEFYQQLQNDKRFRLVEMEIDYSPVSTAETF
ncbi:hypothetical protein [Thalassotalea sp. ND16A]|uniref:hypothetical protein n=1 Tax=Thalassotalea sp. ND16A TaxID=1535422 RepID=UPI000519EF76|nr:hypothetical protein [Thalassotalea sp. ND16A]KGJ99329.1 hypothetical protein ND16A_3850 [Thalassotalea sp. ND16A]